MKKERAGWLLIGTGLISGPFSALVFAVCLVAGAVLIILSTKDGRD